MGLFHFEVNSNYCYGIWKMDEDEEALKKILRYELPIPYTNPGKRIEFLSVRALVMQMNADPLSIDYLPSGKPFLKKSNTNISISHTRGYAAVMLSNLQHIGADIEHKSDRILKLRSKFMHPDEEIIVSKQTGDEVTSLLLHWSAKESLFKAIPDEGVDFIKELHIIDFKTPNEKGSFGAIALRSGMNFRVDYRIEDEFVFTACIPQKAKAHGHYQEKQI